MAALRLNLGTQGQKKTVKKTVKNFIIPTINKLLKLSRYNLYDLEVQSIFFNYNENKLHLYCLRLDGKLEIITTYEKGQIICALGRHGTEINPAVKLAIERALLQTIMQSKPYKKNNPNKGFIEENIPKLGNKVLYDARWLTELQFLLYGK